MEFLNHRAGGPAPVDFFFGSSQTYSSKFCTSIFGEEHEKVHLLAPSFVLQMGAANDKERQSAKPMPQLPLTCCMECTMCSARPVSATTSAKTPRKNRTFTEIEIARLESEKSGRQVVLVAESNINILSNARLNEMNFEIAGGADRFKDRNKPVGSTSVLQRWQHDAAKANDPRHHPPHSILLRQAPERLESRTPTAVGAGGEGDCTALQHPPAWISRNEGNSGCSQQWQAGARRPIRLQVSIHSLPITGNARKSRTITPKSLTIASCAISSRRFTEFRVGGNLHIQSFHSRLSSHSHVKKCT